MLPLARHLIKWTPFITLIVVHHQNGETQRHVSINPTSVDRRHEFREVIRLISTCVQVKQKVQCAKKEINSLTQRQTESF